MSLRQLPSSCCLAIASTFALSIVMPPSTVTLERVRLPSRVKYHTAVIIIATTLNTSTPQNTCFIKSIVPGSRYFFGFCFRDGNFMCEYKDGRAWLARLISSTRFSLCPYMDEEPLELELIHQLAGSFQPRIRGYEAQPQRCYLESERNAPCLQHRGNGC